jgi:hypothetical protein
MKHKTDGFITITDSGYLAELPRFNTLPPTLLFKLAFTAAKNDGIGCIRLLEEVPEFAELRMFCDVSELALIVKVWVHDSVSGYKL